MMRWLLVGIGLAVLLAGWQPAPKEPERLPTATGLLDKMCAYYEIAGEGRVDPKAAERAGLAAAVGKLLSPLTRRLFPKLSKKEQNQKGPKEGSALEAVTMNLTANFLGLGNAATPLGIKAMERMAAQSPKGSAATDEMILFLVCNTAAVQLFPSTLAAVRQASGAARPLDVLPAVWIASLAALAAGVGSALLMGRMSRRREGAGR